MAGIAHLLPGERRRFFTLGLLLLINGLTLEANEVIATSGFVSRVGVEQILWVWAADMLIVMLTSGAYSLFVDRMRRERLGIAGMAGFGLAYVALYLLLHLGVPEWLFYLLLTVVNDQQWIMFPMLIWALANDVFSTAEAKRVFPLLAMAAFGGGVLGNVMTATAARWWTVRVEGSVDLLLVNALLLLAMAVILLLSVRRLSFSAHQARRGERVLDTLREGAAFVREVPSYRYLTLAMVLLGIGLNVVEYQMIAAAATVYAQTTSLEGFYATIRAARIVLMVLAQGMLAGWLLEKLGLKTVFAAMPVALLGGLLIAFAWPALLGVVIAEYLARITLEGVDEPSRRTFLGLVPDERRGRVSAFIDGYLYPAGSILGCFLVGSVLLAVGQGLLAPEIGRALYFGLAIACALAALWAIALFRLHYDSSLLNWRLKRRRRGSVLANVRF